MWTSVKRDHIRAIQTLGVLTQLAHMSAHVCLDIKGMDGVIAIEKVELEKFLYVYLSSYLCIYLYLTTSHKSSRHLIIYTVISMFVIRWNTHALSLAHEVDQMYGGMISVTDNRSFSS